MYYSCIFFNFYRGKDESIPRYFPRAVKICVGGAGHLIHQDFPDIFMTELLKFIESWKRCILKILQNWKTEKEANLKYFETERLKKE